VVTRQISVHSSFEAIPLFSFQSQIILRLSKDAESI
jgi:hypothetical protein